MQACPPDQGSWEKPTAAGCSSMRSATLPFDTAPAQLVVQPTPGQLRSKESMEMLMQLERGNKARVARALGISRGALYRDLESWGIEEKKKQRK
jgi:DNA-binding NtrC family response regulator